MNETTRSMARFVSSALAFGGGFLVAASTTAPLGAWIATALVMLGGWGLAPLPGMLARRIAIPERWSGRLLLGLPYLVVTAVVLWALWPVPLGEVPFTQDHAHHYLQTAVLTDNLLPGGNIFGWTERVGGGLPFGDVYGTAVYFLTGFLRIVTFGLVSRATSYSLGLVLVWSIPAWALVAWTRRLLQPMSTDPIVLAVGPIVAASAFVLDVGGDREGGWVYSMFHAVWPQIAATGFWLLTLLAMVRLVERPTVRRLAVAVIVSGFAFWAHPMNAMNLLFTAPVLFLAAIVQRRDDDGDPRAAAWWLVPAFAMGAVIGFAWIAHMLAASDDLLSFTAYGESLATYADRILNDGAPFDGGIALVGIAGLLGAFFVARVGRTEHLFTIAGFVLFGVLASTDLFASSDFGLSESAPFVMFKRFVITAKPLFFAMAGVGLAMALATMRQMTNRPSPLAVGLLLVVSAPAVWSLADVVPRVVRTPEARILTGDAAKLADPLGKVAALVEREQSSALGPKQVVLWYERGDVGDYALFAVAEAGVGYVANRNPPAHAYRELNTLDTVEEATLMGASHIVTRAERDFPGARKIAEFPPYFVWRLNADPDDGVTIRDASGQVKTTAWSPMRHEVEVTDATKKTTLTFALPPYHKWSFTQDGRELETRPTRYGGMTFTEVLGARDGTVVATFEDTPRERAAFVLMLLVLALSIVAVVLGRRPLPVLREPWPGRLAPTALVATMVLATILAWWADREGREAIDEAWASEGERVLEVLHRQKPHVDYAPRPYCVRPMSRNPRLDCDDSVLEPRLVLAPPRGQAIPACMEVTVPDDGFLELRFLLPRGTSHVRGRIDSGRARIVTRALIGIEEVNVPKKRFDLATDDEDITLRFENRGRRSVDVCLEMVAIGQ